MTLSTLLVIASAAGALVFVALYAVMAPFYKSEHGWNLMTFMVVVALMVCQSMYFRITGGRAPEWMSIIDWGIVAVVIWWRVTILLRDQLASRR